MSSDCPGAQADEGSADALANGRSAYTGVPLQKGSLEIALYGRNGFDRKCRTDGIAFGPLLGFAGNSHGAPRAFGLGLTCHFTTS